MSVEKDLVFLGMAKLLEECSVHVPEDLRELIEETLNDASHINPNLKVRRILNRITVELVPSITPG